MYINIQSLIDVQQSVPYWAIHVTCTFDAINFAALDAIHACLNACLNYAAMGMASLPAPVQHAFQATFAYLQRYCRHLNGRWCTTYYSDWFSAVCLSSVFLYSSFSSSCDGPGVSCIGVGDGVGTGGGHMFCHFILRGCWADPSRKGVSRIPAYFKTWTQMSACTISSIDPLFHNINVI